MTYIRKKHSLVSLILLVMVTSLVILGLLQPSQADRPLAASGVMDLSDWNLEKQGIVPLDGEWEFYPDVLLTPGHTPISPNRKHYMQVPGIWDGWQDENGVTMKAYGYGTYRLLLQNAPTDRQLAIAKNYVRFSDKLYVDGNLMGESGRTGSSRDSYEPLNIPYTVYFHPRQSEVEILLQVANFDFMHGGVTNSIELGIGKDMQIKKNFQTGLELMGTALFLLMSVFFISLYARFRENAPLLLCGVFFFFFAISILTNGERLFLQLFPFIPFEAAFKIKGLSVYFAPALFFYASWLFVEKGVFRRILLYSAIALLIYCVCIIALPFRYYSRAQDIVYLGLAAVYVCLALYLLVCYRKGRYGSLQKRQFQLYLWVVWCLLATVMITIFNGLNLISMVLTNTTVILVAFLMAVLLVHQYATTHSSMRKLTTQLQMANQLKDEFLLLTSHELNTPLHGIINLSQSLLVDSLRKIPETTVKERLQLIRNTAYRMSNMVSDIIDAARIKDGRLEVKAGRVDLFACVSIVIETFGFLAKGKNMVLINRIIPEARYVVADEKRLLQVLYNALDYCLRRAQDGTVAIGSENRDSSVIVEIKHSNLASGQPASEEAEQMKRTNSLNGGFLIADELMVLMGGTFIRHEAEGIIEIGLPSALDGGASESAVTSELNAHVKTKRMMEGSTKEHAAKILIASADLVDMEHLCAMMELEGYEVICAGTDSEALAIVAGRDRPDLVMLDVMIPETGGYELCRQIRQDFTQMELPVLFITVRSTPADIEAGIAAGGSDFIVRPLTAAEIRMRINTLLSLKRLVKEAATSEMAFLRSQIKPHFLYNVLSTIMSLCYTDGVKAGELLSSFSKYLRIIFHLDHTEETVPLRKEMELIQAYVTIEKARFGERVNVVFDVDEQLFEYQVMPLMIEPLVENAIRHGVSQKINGGTVRLTIRRQEEFIQVIVEDDGAGMSLEKVQSIMGEAAKSQGVGFKNIMRRVMHMSGKQPVVESWPGKGTKVTIWVPLILR